jgi:hypothetical protein
MKGSCGRPSLVEGRDPMEDRPAKEDPTIHLIKGSLCKGS